MAPASAYAMGLLVGAAPVEIWSGAEVEGDEDGDGVVETAADVKDEDGVVETAADVKDEDGVVEIVAVESGRVTVGVGAVTVEDTGTMIEV